MSSLCPDHFPGTHSAVAPEPPLVCEKQESVPEPGFLGEGVEDTLPPTGLAQPAGSPSSSAKVPVKSFGWTSVGKSLRGQRAAAARGRAAGSPVLGAAESAPRGGPCSSVEELTNSRCVCTRVRARVCVRGANGGAETLGQALDICDPHVLRLSGGLSAEGN